VLVHVEHRNGRGAFFLFATSLANAQNVQLNIIFETLEIRRSDIVSAEAVIERDEWVVWLRLTPGAAEQFGQLTARDMQLVLGERVVVTTRIRSAITGGALILGDPARGAAWAKELAA
jgi:preprotein translocase subunit SecD